MRENPFRYGQVVSNKYFTNREIEIKEIKEGLISGQSIILISPRRYGKTSLVMKAVSDLKLPVLKFDMQLIIDELDFANILVKRTLSLSKFEKIKNLLKTLRILPSVQYNPQTQELSVSISPEGKDIRVYLEDAFELIEKMAKNIKKRIIVVFDEFQEIRRISDDLEKKMRAILQYHKEVSYVFIGSQEHMIRDIFENRNNPFYKFGRQMILKEIEYSKMKEFIIERFSSQNIDAKKMAEEILKITGNHPYYTQQLCSEIFIISDKEIIKEEMLEKAIRNILSNHNSDYQKWWNGLDNTERKILIGFCKGNKNPTSAEFLKNQDIKSASTAGSAIKRLQEKGILIAKNGDTYSIEDPFWQRWIISNRR